MTTLIFQSGRMASRQWQRLGTLLRAYRRDHSPLTQEQLAERITSAVEAAAKRAGVEGAVARISRYTKQDVSRIEAWARPPEARRPRRLPRIVHTYQLEGIADILGMRVADMLGTPGAGGMRSYELEAAPARVANLTEVLQRHEPTADGAVVWSKHLITMFFPTDALYAYYRANYSDGGLAENWVRATVERRETVLERAAKRRWWFTHVLFASDLVNVVKGEETFASIDRQLRASCLEGVRRAIVEVRNCRLAVLDDLSPGNATRLAALRTSVGAYGHVSHMGDGCVILGDLLGVWHVGEHRPDVAAYRIILRDLIDSARFSEPDELAPYLDSLIQRTLLAHG